MSTLLALCAARDGATGQRKKDLVLEVAKHVHEVWEALYPGMFKAPVAPNRMPVR